MKKRTDARPSLPTAAALVVNDGRLIEAIKIVRETDRLDLTAAKARVDAYIAADPRLAETTANRQRDAKRRLIVWVVAIDAVLVVAGLIWWRWPSLG